MTPTKLSDSDKREILRLYRQSDENTITLAKRYGVSSSTVRRLLQSALSEPEYESLVQKKQKRLPDRSVSEQIDVTIDSSTVASDPDSVIYAFAPQSVPNSRPTIRKRSVSTTKLVADIEAPANLLSDLDVSDKSEVEIANITSSSDYVAAVTGELKEMLPEAGLLVGEDFSDFDEDEDEDEDEDDADLDDFDDGEDLEDEDSLFEASLLGLRSSGASLQLQAKTLIQVLPLSEASLPKICYLVVDRASELITRPLKAFGELGQIPPEEIREKTLPVFDNHRIARRFSSRNQRVFKVPDGKMLQKAAPYLQAKGITRLLIDGQVYSLYS
jgi:transposase-like protein